MPAPSNATRQLVQEYYGQRLESTSDLRTMACCAPEDQPVHIKAALTNVNDEVLTRFYGCGSPIPPALAGATVLDLGCGTGRDVYVAAQFVGPEGHVIGVDMTEEQLAVARKHEAAQAERFGFDAPNTSFHHGYIEDLKALGIADASVDVVISNCVLNLSADKRAAFAEIFRVLKEGGELYFSDVFADRRIPDDVAADPVLYGECLGGAFYEEDFRRMLRDVGCLDYRTVSSCPIEIDDPELADKLGNIRFTSKTIRAFKLEAIEDRCEDYGQVAYYQGGIPEQPHAFVLDDHHRFERGRPMLVCGNSAAMVEETRFGRYFEVVGDRSVHYGLFDCDPAEAEASDGGGCC
ncbi:MAG: methyltransferase domain-containing protein [Bacteroidetes bacterium]|nr:methyltransferase domain-containing protein [Bacteroidota bacterium]